MIIRRLLKFKGDKIQSSLLSKTIFSEATDRIEEDHGLKLDMLNNDYETIINDIETNLTVRFKGYEDFDKTLKLARLDGYSKLIQTIVELVRTNKHKLKMEHDGISNVFHFNKEEYVAKFETKSKSQIKINEVNNALYDLKNKYIGEKEFESLVIHKLSEIGIVVSRFNILPDKDGSASFSGRIRLRHHYDKKIKELRQ